VKVYVVYYKWHYGGTPMRTFKGVYSSLDTAKAASRIRDMEVDEVLVDSHYPGNCVWHDGMEAENG
jgi:hypothetical protein